MKILTGLSVASDSPQKLGTHVQPPLPSLCASPKFNGINKDEPSLNASIIKQSTAESLIIDKFLIAEKIENVVNNINVVNRTDDCDSEEDNILRSSVVLSGIPNLTETDKPQSLQKTSDDLDCTVLVSSVSEKISCVSSDAEISKKNNSLAGCAKTSSEQEDEKIHSNPDDDEDQEPLSLIFDDPANVPDSHHNLGDNFYDYEAYRNSIEVDVDKKTSSMKDDNCLENSVSSLQCDKINVGEDEELKREIFNIIDPVNDSNFGEWTFSENSEVELQESDNFQDFNYFNDTALQETNFTTSTVDSKEINLDKQNKMNLSNYCGQTGTAEEAGLSSPQLKNIIKHTQTMEPISVHECSNISRHVGEKCEQINEDISIEKGISDSLQDSTICNISEMPTFSEGAILEDSPDNSKFRQQDSSDNVHFLLSNVNEFNNEQFFDFEDHLSVGHNMNQSFAVKDPNDLDIKLQKTIEQVPNLATFELTGESDNFGNFADFSSTQVFEVPDKSENGFSNTEEPRCLVDGQEDEFGDFESCIVAQKHKLSQEEPITQMEFKNVSLNNFKIK